MSQVIIFTVTLFTSLQLWAGDKIGNGGGLWTCSQNHSLQIGVLVDLYEAQEEFGLNLISSFENDPMRIVQERSDFARLNLPEYSAHWNQLLAESAKKIRLVNSELIIIDDALFRIKPSPASCQNGWTYTQFANYTNMDQILIRQDLWNSPAVQTTHKAALIWHEVIYKWLRDKYNDKDSTRTRQIVGYLFSTTSPAEIRLRINQILAAHTQPPPPGPVPPPTQPNMWMCMTSNRQNSTFFADYGFSKLEAQSKTDQKCKMAADGFFCEDRGTTCEEITQPHNKFTCQIGNRHISQIYFGSGRTRLEAEFKARDACQQTPEKFFCDSTVTCD